MPASPSRFRLPRSPLQRLRLLFLAGALGALLLAIPAVVGSEETSPLGHGALVFAMLVVGAHWVRGFRRRGFAWYAEIPETLVVAAVLLASSGDPILPLLAIMFRSLYGPPRRAVLRTVLYVGALVGDGLYSHAGLADEGGRIVGLVLGALIMQGLRVALKRNERAEKVLRAILSHSTDIACVLAPDLRIQWQGASIERVLGHDHRGLVDTPFLQLVHAGDVATLEQLFAELGPGESGTATVRIRDASGSYRSVEAAVGNHVSDRYLGGWLLNLRDATERERLERERRALAEQRAADDAHRLELERLHERVEAQRQRQELEARLQRSQRLESVGQLAGGIAHDFNNLLVVILNYAALVHDDLPEDSPMREDLAEIVRAADRGAALTRQLLLFSQRKAARPEVLDLNEIIGDLDRLLERSLGDGIALSHEAGADLWPVEADPGNVEQVVVNLVVNARDAIEGRGKIVVSTENVCIDAATAVDLEIPEGRYTRVAVSDDGCGMDADTVGRAFEPFFTTKPTGKGTGLGLATVYGIATQSGGAVVLDSRPGEGTTAHVYFPATEKVIQVRPPEEHAEIPPSSGERLLVVEDEDAVRALVQRVLENEGYEVVVAASAEDALSLVAADPQPFELVLSDVIMPGITGIELAARLRERRPDQPIVLMTGYSRELFEGAGARTVPGLDSNHILAKPFDPPTLRAIVRRTLDAAARAVASQP